MAAQLADYRLVFIGPAFGQTSVGDYSDNLVEAVRPCFAEVVQNRTPGPGNASAADVLRHRKEVARLVADGPPGRTLVHAEIAAGGITPFWSIAGLSGVPVTATVHDPPQGVWAPARTHLVAKHRLLMHGIHYPLRPVWNKVEGRVYRDRTLIALTDAGRRALERSFLGVSASYVPCMSFDRRDILPVQDRPRAVGFFGHVYRGKGFDQITRFRELLPDDIAIRIAGRGTETLPAMDGVEVLGGVDGPDEDAFFESVRAIVLPYGKRHFYGEIYPASGVGASAQSYSTPVISTGYGPLAELDESTGGLIVEPQPGEDGVATALAGAIVSLLDDRDRLTQLGINADKTRHARSRASTGAAYAAIWSRIVAESATR